MSEFKQRLQSLWGPNIAPSAIAAEIGMSITGFMRVWNDGAIPKAETLIKIKEAKGCSIDWLLTGHRDGTQPLLPQADAGTADGCPCVDTLGNPVNLQDFVFIPRYNLKASAGHGRCANGEKPIFSMAFRRYWIDNFLRIDPHDLSVISVKGDSMEGVLNDRDVILINHADNAPKDGLYVLRIDGDLVVKRLQRKLGGKIGIISANEAYAPYDIDLNDLPNDFAIVGRVVWFGRQL
ncbi:S24 family peptidase [Laribacter hongkongensis]|uniref:S24 family peptidase n=1 Tax=Laribacter hongkongensis TaxID=168471 RepID=UPI001EFD2FCF|nr:helix-turn-helix transcriptional regulator [Laribacter hongkongensis]MCG9033317.1 helix-turn-helix transcriptional regulator [Laribacter hongkongensis]MCG9093394.1 helix-turn-helix transcriptional regulator [Laribacter hongkongensis]